MSTQGNKVLTVPMRNGNTSFRASSETPPPSSYRTYEEWKQYYESWNDNGTLVLTVPMRNGNFHWARMVTRQSRVLTVPMRNGNHNQSARGQRANKGSYRTYEEWKHLLTDR